MISVVHYKGELMTVQLIKGQNFSFIEFQRGGVYYRENKGYGPYAVPAKYYKGLLEGAEFIDQKEFTGAEIFEVEEAHRTRKGWHVVGKMQGECFRVSFYQKLDKDGLRFVEVKVH